jgi:hypothetical protein
MYKHQGISGWPHFCSHAVLTAGVRSHQQKCEYYADYGV